MRTLKVEEGLLFVLLWALIAICISSEGGNNAMLSKLQLFEKK